MTRTAAILFALVFLSYAYFRQGAGWNHNTRFDLARALVEQHSLALDDYRKNTHDIAFSGTHYYSDKAPLTGVLAAAPYAFMWQVRVLLPEEFQRDRQFLPLASYVVTLAVSGLAGALTALLLYGFARRCGASPRVALAPALIYGLGSIAFPFATVLFGHVLAAALLFGSFYLGSRSARWYDAVAGGVLAAAAAFAEYPTVGASLLVGLYLAWQAGRARWWKALGLYSLGALMPIALAALYAWICFGDILAVGYNKVVNGDIGKASWFGFSYPKPDVVVELLVGLSRGLLIGSPALALCGAGLVVGLRRRRQQPWVVLCVAVSAFYLLLISSFKWWEGGFSFGPRHLIPMLPFLALGAVPAAERWPRQLAAALAVSMVLMLAGTAHTIIPPSPSGVLDPLFQVAGGEVALSVRGVHHYGESGNLGLLLGLPGVASLVPLVVMWAGGAVLLWRSTSAA